MSHESVPEHTGPSGQSADDHGRQEPPVPEESATAAGGGAPKGLLQQMEELMAALNADLSRLDADLQSSADRTAGAPGTPPAPGGRAAGSERPARRPQ